MSQTGCCRVFSDDGETQFDSVTKSQCQKLAGANKSTWTPGKCPSSEGSIPVSVTFKPSKGRGR